MYVLQVIGQLQNESKNRSGWIQMALKKPPQQWDVLLTFAQKGILKTCSWQVAWVFGNQPHSFNKNRMQTCQIKIGTMKGVSHTSLEPGTVNVTMSTNYTFHHLPL